MNILEEAQKLVDGDRQTEYNSPSECLGKTAELFNSVSNLNIKAQDVAIFNICQKLARLSHTHKRDTIVDIAGYLYILGDKLGVK